MIHYVYILKCPNCEDEFFDFFEDAKTCALKCLSDKPIITQTEVNRNDFGECTDHCDLGTVWSWEDMMDSDCEKADTTTSSVLSKKFLDTIDFDSEFDSIDNSVDYEVEEPEAAKISDMSTYVDKLPNDFRKSIPEGMTIEELVEAMEENEDTVECTKCGGLFEKASCTHNKEGFGWCCTDCEPADTLTEDTQEEYDLVTLVKDSISHLTNDLGKDPWADDFADDVIGDLERNYENYVPTDFDKYQEWCSAVASEVSRQVNNSDNLTEASLSDIAAAANSEFGSDWNSEDLLDMAGVEDDFRHTDISTGMTPSEKATFDLEQERERAYKNKLSAWKRYQKKAKQTSKLEELEEATDYRKRLTPCPECGAENTFDHETGFCLECGFNI